MIHQTKNEDGARCAIVLSEVAAYVEDGKNTMVVLKECNDSITIKTNIKDFHKEMENYFKNR